MKSPTGFLLALANSAHLTACADITFPVVGLGPAGGDSNQFVDLYASVITVQNDITTYSVGCSTTSCAGWDNLPSKSETITVAIGPSTIDVRFSDLPYLSSRSACTFQGSPPTAATCDVTDIIGMTSTQEHHIILPSQFIDSVTYNIMSATLKVIDGSADVTDTASVPTGTASMTGTPTTTPTEGSEASNTASSSASVVTSSGFAREAGGPAAKWVVGMGVAVGAMVAA